MKTMKATIKQQIKQASSTAQILEALERADKAHQTGGISTADYNIRWEEAMARLRQINGEKPEATMVIRIAPEPTEQGVHLFSVFYDNGGQEGGEFGILSWSEVKGLTLGALMHLCDMEDRIRGQLGA